MSEILEARNVALVFDIHGNLGALEAVLDDIEARSDIDLVVFGGDYALNGPQPAACVQRAMETGHPAIMGNTDEYLTTGYEVHGEDPVVEWTHGALDGRQLEWLAERPFDVSVAPPGKGDEPESLMHVVHANPVDTERPLLVEPHPYSEWAKTSEDEASELLAGERAQVTVLGHIHCPMAGRFDGHRVRAVGSVGFPWDGNQKAAYGLARWNGNGWTLQDIRLSYDTNAAIEALEQSGMPQVEARIESLEDASFAPLAEPDDSGETG
jgi:predicted phosphodiesterase